MEDSNNIDWIVDALIDLNAYCEREGLEDVSAHLIEAIESVAPIIRGRSTPQDGVRPTNEHLKLVQVLQQRR